MSVESATRTAALPSARTLRLLAAALEYPGEGTRGAWERLGEEVAREAPALAAPLSRFRSAVRNLSAHECQEVYAATFDIHPARCLYVGYHLFGDSYKRGAFMARLSGEYRACGFDPSAELPDHLCVLLRFMAERIDEHMDETEEWIADLVEVGIVPALGIVVDQFAGSSNPYGFLLQAALRLFAGAPARTGGPRTRPLPVIAAVVPGAMACAPQPEPESLR